MPVFFSVAIGHRPADADDRYTHADSVPRADGKPRRGGTGESLDSQGQPVFTDSNGQARDVLRTRWPREAQARSVTVTARTASDASDDSRRSVIN